MPEGYQLIVLDRGAVHICFPEGWIARPSDKGSMRLHDAEPPDDSCRLEISYWKLHPVMALNFPFETAVKVLQDTKTELEHEEKKEPVLSRRDGLRFGWVESQYPDPDNGRAVCSRSLLVVGNKIQVIITYDCWADETERFEPVWKTLLRTIRLGEYIANPASGQVIKPDLN